MSQLSTESSRKQPRGLYVLFFAEMWERFSFYGMRALLSLYMTKRLKYSDDRAYGVYGAYGALVYAFPVVGGLLADKLLGYRLAIVIGGILMAIGHFVMAIEHEWFFYAALALLCLGNGFFKPNISSLVGKLYDEHDERRDGGFTIFYMGINLGALLAPIVCGNLGERVGWHVGFGAAGVGMVIGLFWFIRGQNHFSTHGMPPDPDYLLKSLAPGLNRYRLVMIGSMLMVPLVGLGLFYNDLVGYVIYLIGAFVLISLLTIGFRAGNPFRDRTFLVLVLMVFDIVFWAFFEQAGSSLTLFTERNVDRTIFGWDVPASLFQAVNPFFIIVLAPLFALLWKKLNVFGKNPSIPMKFSLGLVQLGLGFLALVIGSSMASPQGLTPVIWLVIAYLLHTTGELCLSPVGLSAITKLAPPEHVGQYMGSWFLASSFAHHVGGAIAKLTAGAGGATEEKLTDLVASLAVYSTVFKQIFWFGLGAGIFLAVMTPLLKKLSHGVE